MHTETSEIARYFVSISGPMYFSKGTTSVGTVPTTMEVPLVSDVYDVTHALTVGIDPQIRGVEILPCCEVDMFPIKLIGAVPFLLSTCPTHQHYTWMRVCRFTTHKVSSTIALH